MSETGADSEARRQRILDAAAELIIQYGYDKTTIGDVANRVGLSRGLIYLLFKNKDDLLEALLAREVQSYTIAWLDYIESDPRGGTIASTYRGVLYALNSNPFMAAIVKRDTHIFGGYLRKPGNLFEAAAAPSMMTDLLRMMQDAGAVRADVNLSAAAAILDILSYGLVGMMDIRPAGDMPPFDDLVETIATMLDRLLTPDDGGNREAGKAILRQLGDVARAQMTLTDDTVE
jgi:AcrR family transcriptional regulator